MLERGKISLYQYVSILILFLHGTGGFIPIGMSAHQSSWMVIPIAALWGFLLLYIYSALFRAFPGMTVIQILPEVFGKMLGKVVAFLFIFYFLHLTTLTLRSTVDFLTVILPKTPIVVLALTFILLAVFAVVLGIEVIGRISEFLTPISFVLLFSTLALSWPDMDFDNLRPLLPEGLKPLLHGLIDAIAYPFGEVVLFLMIIPFLNTPSKVNRGSFVGLLLTGIFISILFLRSFIVFGFLTANISYAGFRAIGYINIGGFLERGESFFVLAYFMIAIVKLIVCFYASVLGLAQVFNLRDYKFLVYPLTLLAVTLSILMFENNTEEVQFMDNIYPIYVFPLSFVIPLLTLLMAKLRKQTNN